MAVSRPDASVLRSWVKDSLPRSLVIRRLRHSPTPTVLLTFDDGPHPSVTPAVLDRLAAYDARAVFFVVGRRLRRGGEALDRARAAGHLIGNHSHLHRDRYVLPGGRQARFLEYYRDCARCQTVIEHRTGTRPLLFRPPGGRLTFTTLLAPRILGLRCVTWSQDIGDWAFRDPSEAQSGAARLLAAVAPRDILLLHDDNARVLDVLDTLLPAFRSRGYDLRSGVDLL
jgi:peptidoglycan/xylan/chitin deacetylase (PgdA/CDA1 family)